MKFLICGIGSIGQRHYKNLVSLGHDGAIFRSRKNVTPHIKKFLTEEKKQKREVKIFFDLEKAIQEFNPDAVFVTNPTSLHAETALKSARLGCHVFIEKPVSHDLKRLNILQKIAKKKNLKIMIGYNFRFHPLLQKMKKLVDMGTIGKPISAQVEAGENVEDWHPWENYKKTYSVNKKLGGGVVLSFSHDIDYLYWFFGMPKVVASSGGKLTPLLGDAEDMVESLLEFPNKAIASLHLDFWQRPKKRTFDLIGAKGEMSLDFETGILQVSQGKIGKKKIFKAPSGFERNSMYIEEAKSFIQSIKKNTEPEACLAQGIDVLKIALKIKKKISF